MQPCAESWVLEVADHCVPQPFPEHSDASGDGGKKCLLHTLCTLLWEVNKSNKCAPVWLGRDDVQTGSQEQDRTGCRLPPWSVLTSISSSFFYCYLFGSLLLRGLFSRYGKQRLLSSWIASMSWLL